MKRKIYKNRGFSFIGALVFFIVIALVIQIAVIFYDRISEITDDNFTIAALLLIVIIVLSSICTLIDYIRRRISVDRPVAKILSATEKIASGDFSVRVDIEHTYDKYDESDIIAENLNTMAAELGKSELLKTDFISNVSHEIKTPLAVIQSYAASLSDKNLDEETRTHNILTIISASKRLSELITNILQLNKLETREIKPEFERINLTEMLAEAIINFDVLIEQKDISVECDLDDVYVNSAPSYLEIVWYNLLSNAIKFTEQGGTVNVSLKKQGDRAVVKIRDTGCGPSVLC